eukprot:m.38599 g.38599  ORF g.38599 m.38599 type:complete len:229 (-) comp9453_c0_seq2:150-836(-)
MAHVIPTGKVTTERDCDPNNGIYHASLMPPSLLDTLGKEEHIKQKKQGESEGPFVNSETSIVTHSMKTNAEVEQINNAGMLPMDESGIRLKFRTAQPLKGHLDQVDKALKFQAKPSAASLGRRARRPIKQDYDNNFSHVMSHGYQADFVNETMQRTEKLHTSKQKKMASLQAGATSSTDRWMKSRDAKISGVSRPQPSKPKPPQSILDRYANVPARVNTHLPKNTPES